ncbi:MAG: SDR family oxidoreductase [Alphaproteobacteria bacterium]|nr:SDR family oxidoreductase [Alphaproteobacteria bacterium]MDE2109677.1 SDR family oxidoreductase [Alphaproteobacteria bacterium]MDE2492378.1 SDR family oxidoreductase [Alphaproteobacteria bacterium]
MARKQKGSGLTALVTGASGGIGLELARCFAKDGYDLILVARSADKLQVAADDLGKRYRVQVAVAACDLGAVGAGAALAERLGDRPVDVLVNNAGYGDAGSFAATDLKAQLGMIDLNIRALVELTHVYWPRMLKNGYGGVLNVASTAAFQPGPFMAIYYASKAFVLSFSEALWEEARGTGVYVSCLCPGATESDFHVRAGTDKVRLLRMGQMSAAKVARLGHRAFKANRRVKIAGLRNAFMAWSVPFSPRPLVLRLVRYLQSA